MDQKRYARWMKKVVQSEAGCWEWKGAHLPAGYGCAWDGQQIVRVHRAMYEHFNGAIPKGYFVLHACDNPSCCNPDHLFVGTQRTNIRDAMAKGRHIAPPVGIGAANGRAKITAQQVAEIRAAYKGRQHKEVQRTGPTLRELSEQYGLAMSHIRRIIHGESWQ